MEYNAVCTGGKFKAIAEAMKEEDIQFLAESACADARAPGNPRAASVEDLKTLIRKLI